MNKFCHSCGMPLMGEAEKTARGDFCQYCADEAGNLYPKEMVKKGISEFLASWAPTKEGVDFGARAEAYMNAMPAWAER